MAQFTANRDFRIKITVGGRNTLFACTTGQTVELSDEEHAAIVRDLPDAFASVGTKKGATKKASTRQVTKGDKS